MSEHRTTKFLFALLLISLLVVPALAITMRINATHDGYVYETTEAEFNDIRDDSGTSSGNSPSTSIYAGYLLSGTTEDQYVKLTRGIISFNTSEIPDNADISSATITARKYQTFGSLLHSNASIMDVDVGNTMSYVYGDYDTTTFTRLATDVDYANFTGWVTWTLNNDGIARISTLDDSAFMFTFDSDVDNNDIDWNPSSSTGFMLYSRNYHVTTGVYPYVQYMTIEYELSVPSSDFTANITRFRSPLSVQFTDLTTRVPTGWNWSYRINGTSDWTAFSAIQNPPYLFPTGVYDINLTTTNELGPNTTIKTSYINSVDGYPLPSFTTDISSGLSPLTVNFTDTSDADGASWAWDFGDGSSSIEQNPNHTFSYAGSFIVNLTVTNATGSDSVTHTMYSEISHPVLWDIQNTPGYLNPTVEPYKSDLANIMSEAAGGSSYYNSLAYQITGNTDYANTTISVLYENSWNTTTDLPKNSTYNQMSSLYWYIQGYDMIHQTKNTNSTLTDEKDARIRDWLANLADREYYYWDHNWVYGAATCAPDDRLLGYKRGYPYQALAMSGWVLSDYGSALPHGTTPTMWKKAGKEYLFESDTISTYIAGRNGVLGCTNDVNYGQGNLKGFLDEGYTSYYDNQLYKWFNIYQHINGHSIFVDYPGWEGLITNDVWSNLPNTYTDNTHDASLMKSYATKLALNTLDTTNRSNMVWFYALRTYEESVDSVHWANDPTESRLKGDWYLLYYQYPNETPAPPNNLNVLSGIFTFIRGDWTDRSDWLNFVVWNYSAMGQARTSQVDTNQLAIQYYSHGDFLIPAQSDVKFMMSPLNSYYTEIMENSPMFGNDSVLFTRYAGQRQAGQAGAGFYGYGNNLTVRSIQKATASRDITKAYHGFTVDNQFMTIAEGHADITTLRSSTPTGTSYIYTPNIAFNRTILYPKDYMIIIDRANSASDWRYTIPFFLGSIMLNSTKSIDGDYTVCKYDETHAEDYHLICPNVTGNVKGTLKVGGTQKEWLSSPPAVEEYLGVSNTIEWNTTNPYGEGVNMTIFTTPSSNISFIKWGTRLGTSSSYAPEVYLPRMLINQEPMNKTLYRVTSLLTNYANETGRTPTELTVTGIGSATKIIAADSSYTDYIYTGAGTSTFDVLNTDADMAFVRNESGISHYTLINGTFLKDGENTKFESNLSVSIDWNEPTLSKSKFNVSGTGTALLKFYNETAPAVVTKDGVNLVEEGNWTMNGTIFELTTSLSDHYIEYGEIIAPVTDFTGTPLTGATPLTVYFTDTSINSPDTWNWTFGAANYSEERNPSYTFVGEGLYTVVLNATNGDGSDTETKVDYINVTSAPLYPVADFIGNTTSGDSPLVVNFTDLSTNTPTSWYWDFGDGNTSTDQNPENTFYPGSYDIALQATNAEGSDWYNISGYITVNEIPIDEEIPIANFTVSATMIRVPGTLVVNDTSLNSPSELYWDFGDGSENEFGSGATHKYTKRGVFNMSLTAINLAGQDIKYQNIVVSGYSMNLFGVFRVEV